MRFLIDGDVYVYHACHAAQREVQFDRTLTRVVDEPELHARLEAMLVGHMKEVHQRLRLKKKAETTVALSGVRSANWRKGVLPTYKGNRRPELRPIGFESALAWIRERWDVEEVENLEADDVLGIRATEDDEAVIFTTDKDLRQIPCYVARPGSIAGGGSDELSLQRIEPADADRFHLMQTLTGDQVDNYSGCPGCGPKTAEKVLDGKTGAAAWSAILAQYAKAGLLPEDALVQARVARILRSGEFDFKRKQVKLWLPPKA